ncbi:MAG: sigma 54-interacting transcriptional regulator, partial [Planctomycetota bacterium]
METILIVDDEKEMCWMLSNLLREEKYQPITAGNAQEALKAVNKTSPELILLDLRLPDLDGIEVLKKLKNLDRNLPVIMLTAYGDISSAAKAMKLGAVDYITKPFDNNGLLQLIKKTLQIKYLSREFKNLNLPLGDKLAIGEVMGNSPQIRHIFEQVMIVAPTNMTVILWGESGTGKELISQMIHHHSPRRDKPFIPIDCGTFPESLIESELFGHEKGAFTGAETSKEGRFELAEGGTIFLDEINSLTESTQRRFLRVLEE